MKASLEDAKLNRVFYKCLIYRFGAFFSLFICIVGYYVLDFYLTDIDPLTRRFLVDPSCALDNEDCPEPSTLIVTANPQGQEWIIIFYIIGVFYMFIGLAIVCDEYFVPSLEVIAANLNLSDDVAGATLMAAGGSAPELFTSAIGTFQKSAVGFGTITGSAVFNVLFVIAMCALYAEKPLRLTWWPLARDCTYYILGLGVLALFFVAISDGEIAWYEALILFLMYFGYVTLMYYNVKLHKWICVTFNIPEVKKTDSDAPNVSFNQPSTFRAGILSLLIKERSIMEVIPYRIVTEIHENLEGTFTKFDVNGDGHIDKDEMKKVFHEMEIFSQAEEGLSDQIFELLDTDQNGHVSFQEFKTWYVGSEYRIEKEIKDIFEKYDKSGDGTISHTEIRDLLIEAGVGEEEVMIQQQRIQRMSTFVQGNLPGNLDGFRANSELSDSLPVEVKTSGKADIEAHNAWVEVTRCATEKGDDSEIVSGDLPMMDQAQTNSTLANNKGGGTIPGSNLNPSLDPNALSEIWNDQESISFPVFQQWYQDQMFHQRKKDAELEAEHAVELSELLEWPSESGWVGKLWFVLVWPLMMGFYGSIPDTRSYRRRSMMWAILGFFNSIVWIGIFSTFMVDMVTWIGFTFGIPDVVMGVTFIAAGTSIPDLLSSVIVAKKGLGDMAVSSSIGSNIFDILVGLPFPWLAYNIINQCPVYIEADNLKISIMVLLCMVFAVILMIHFSGWSMTRKLGGIMFFFFAWFLRLF